MKAPSHPGTRGICFTCAAVLLLWASPQALSQFQGSVSGVVTDWSDRHFVYSNPGTLQEALANGSLEDWLRIVNDPRYQMQQIKRGVIVPGPIAESSGVEDGSPYESARRDGFQRTRNPLHSDWAVVLGSGPSHSVGIDQTAAKYSFSPIGNPDCTNDYVVFPITAVGASNQANILGVNNLYSGTCTGTVPTVLFAYGVGTGVVQTSPALSLDGTKIAFVESITSGSIFHVLKIDKSGNAGCPSSPCNGTAFNSPARPGTNNVAVDTKITMSGGVSVTRSSPFVNYIGDVAYVGDDTGKLHKFTGVFKGTPAEAGSPWPVTVSSGVILSAPVFDGGASQNIFVGGSHGNLFCITSAGAACATASIPVGTGPILDGPIVDGTAQRVFAAANNGTNAILAQATTSLGTQINVTMGMNGTDLYDGAFDNAYFTSIGTGHMYFCGNSTTASTPTMWRVTFGSNGEMSHSNDGSSFGLVTSGNSGTGVDCTPFIEVFNSTQGKDYLFMGLKTHGFSSGTPNCADTTCVLSFALPQSSPFTFPAGANATSTLNLGSLGLSGFIIDNVSGAAGASQVYFGNIQVNTGVQESQSALQ